MFGLSGVKTAASVRSKTIRLGLRRALNHRQLGVSSCIGSNVCQTGKVGQEVVIPSRRFISTAASDHSEESESQQSQPRQTHISSQHAEMISFPSVGGEGQPVLLNAQEHAVGYLSKILNARVYDAAVETDLQEAKNLSAVSIFQQRG